MNHIVRLRHVPLDQLQRIVDPVTEPLTLDEVKAHLRLRHSSEDDYLTSLITTARQMAEEDTRRALMTQTWRLALDQVPLVGVEEWWEGIRDGAVTWSTASAIELPRPPLQSVTHLKTYDEEDVGTIADPNIYYVETGSDPGRISLRAGGTWPTGTRRSSGVEVEFIAGYASAAAVPRPILHGMLLVIAELYRTREALDVGAPVSQVWADYVVRL